MSKFPPKIHLLFLFFIGKNQIFSPINSPPEFSGTTSSTDWGSGSISILKLQQSDSFGFRASLTEGNGANGYSAGLILNRFPLPSKNTLHGLAWSLVLLQAYRKISCQDETMDRSCQVSCKKMKDLAMVGTLRIDKIFSCQASCKISKDHARSSLQELIRFETFYLVMFLARFSKDYARLFWQEFVKISDILILSSVRQDFKYQAIN